jgi:hypothetical protein
MLIYTPQINSRITYIFDFVFSQYYGVNYAVTCNKKEYTNCTTEKICYANDIVEATLQIGQSNLLLEEYVQEQQITIVPFRDINCPFAIEKGVLPFDIFSAIFYLITRYEEYLPHTQNKYGQFQAIDSFAYKNGFLHLPVVDIWLQNFKEILAQHFPKIKFKQRKFTPIMTYDIDVAYAYKGRSMWLTIASWCKDAMQMKFDAVSKRVGVLVHNDKDPYDTYSEILKLAEQYKYTPILFFLVGDKGKFNKNIDWQHREVKNLINKVKPIVKIGIHPSYDTPRNIKLTEIEKNRLEELTGNPVTISRQHYLRVYFPTTYNNLIKLGIADDYTLGFAELPGFRAGTCTPFQFYDLVANEATALTIHPTTFMEGTYAEDLRLKPEDALPKMKQLLDAIKNVQGEFVMIWHNHSLSDVGFWRGWKAVHDEIVGQLKNENG